MDAILDFGVRLVLAIQGLGGWLKLPMEIFSFLGKEEFFILLLPILYWCVDSHLGIRVGLILMMSTSLNDTLKLALHGPRPYWYSSEVNGLAEETSFGAPSGHAQNAMVIWGMIAASLRKWWGWLIAGLLIFFIGFSRLYLGVHFPVDIAAGAFLGWGIGTLAIALEKNVPHGRPRHKKQR